jgi:hypothetical protein
VQHLEALLNSAAIMIRAVVASLVRSMQGPGEIIISTTFWAIIARKFEQLCPVACCHLGREKFRAMPLQWGSPRSTHWHDWGRFRLLKSLHGRKRSFPTSRCLLHEIANRGRPPYANDSSRRYFYTPSPSLKRRSMCLCGRQVTIF